MRNHICVLAIGIMWKWETNVSIFKTFEALEKYAYNCWLRFVFSCTSCDSAKWTNVTLCCVLVLILYVMYISFFISMLDFFMARGQHSLSSLFRPSPLWTPKWFSSGTKMVAWWCLPWAAATSVTQRGKYTLRLSKSVFRERDSQRAHVNAPILVNIVHTSVLFMVNLYFNHIHNHFMLIYWGCLRTISAFGL